WGAIMIRFRVLLPFVALAAFAAVWAASSSAPAQTGTYVPKAQFCWRTQTPPVQSVLCSIIPGDIGPDPALHPNIGVAYNGLPGAPPTSAAQAVQTPFDNLSGQVLSGSTG